MKPLKIMVFALSILFVNYVGGMPTDLKNLFIAHTVFFSPYLLELYPIIVKKEASKLQRSLPFLAFCFGFIMLGLNIAGVFGLFYYHEGMLKISNDYLLWKFTFELDRFILFSCLSYAIVFISTMMFSFILQAKPKLNNEMNPELST